MKKSLFAGALVLFSLVFWSGVSYAFDASTFDHNLRFGARDSDVTALQEFLVDRDYLEVNPTGYFGRLTLDAVKRYQRDQGINPTGFVGPLTLGRISATIEAVGDSGRIEFRNLSAGGASFDEHDSDNSILDGGQPEVHLSIVSGSATITAGQSVQIRLETKNVPDAPGVSGGDNCSLFTSVDGVSTNQGTVASHGTATLSPTKTTTYTVTCPNNGSIKAYDSITITVNSAQAAPTITLDLDPASGIIPVGSTLTATWRTSADAVKCEASHWVPLAGKEGTSGVYKYTPLNNNYISGYDFTVKCETADGKTNSVTKKVQVVAASASGAPIVTLTASPTSGLKGVVNPSLTWRITNNDADKCITGGDWPGAGGEASKNGGTGSMGVLTVAKTYRYTLVCSSNTKGTGPVATAEVVVTDGGGTTVTGNITVNQVTVSPTTVKAGSAFNVTYNWNATTSTSVPQRVFTHFVDASNKLIATDDYMPALSTDQWKGVVSYTRAVTFPSNFTPGVYTIYVGLYDNGSGSGTTLKRLPLTLGSGVTADPNDQYHYKVGQVTVTAGTVVNPVPVVSLSASPGAVAAGQPVTLYFKQSGATSCTYTNWSGAVNSSGQATVNPTATTTYRADCGNAAGNQGASATVVVGATGAPIPNITAPWKGQVLYMGQSARSAWVLADTYAASGTYNIYLAGPGISGKRLIQSVSSSQNYINFVVPSDVTAGDGYYLSFESSSGVLRTSDQFKIASLAATAAPIVTLTADKNAITSADTVNITLTTVNVPDNDTSCTVSTYNYAGVTTNLGTVASHGTIILTPTGTTPLNQIPSKTMTYNVTCANSAGTKATGSITITVVEAPPVSTATSSGGLTSGDSYVSVKVDKSSIKLGDQILLTITVSANVANCSAQGFVGGPGTRALFPTKTTTYSFTCARTSSGVLTGESSTGSVTVTVP